MKKTMLNQIGKGVTKEKIDDLKNIVNQKIVIRYKLICL